MVATMAASMADSTADWMVVGTAVKMAGWRDATTAALTVDSKAVMKVASMAVKKAVL
jgi:hypothetical protein